MELMGFRGAVRGLLRDEGAAVWSDGQIDEGLRGALAAYSRAAPRDAVGTVTLAAEGREFGVGGLAGLLEVAEVWLPWEAGEPEGWARRRAFRMLPGGVVRVEDGEVPAAGEVARVVYRAGHSIQGLDGATTTTVVGWDEPGVALGAAALAAEARARVVVEGGNVAGGARMGGRRWSEERMERWEGWLRSVTRLRGGVVEWGREEGGF